jgi:ketosteroid isomerase-like protein
MHRHLVALVVVAACSGGSKQTSSTTTPAGGDASGSAASVAEKWRQAWETHSADTLAMLYTHDDDLVLVSQGTAYTGWTAVNGYLSAAVGPLKAVHMTLDDVKTASLGADGAVVNASVTRELDDGNGSVTERGSVTLVLRHDGAGWLIVSEHYSYPPTVD